ncbi:protein pellino isoform X2 [Daphnia magna]|uniref:protein pellino isoform X2 n=1 Tax=Daphnia magna TaxID=35525 RepID=UPI001402539E|nr:protein pellino isoform X2 [Daphnia magna]
MFGSHFNCSPASRGSSSGGSQVVSNGKIHGYLIVLGNNGSLPSGDKGRKRSKYCVTQRPKPNGVQPSNQYRVQTPQTHPAVTDVNQHTIFYTLPRHQAVIVEYTSDPTKDMYQIGRSSEEPIDFVVADTVPGSLNKTSVNRTSSCSSNGGQVVPAVGRVAQSTISRFACRLLVERDSLPARAYVYAAGFDSSRNIFLGEKATKWETDKGIDGLTTNGVLLLQPKGEFEGGAASPGQWVEVSVGGALYHLRDSRSAPQKKSQVENEFNLLVDGSLIDLCGATLLWRSAEGLAKGPTARHLEKMVDELNAGKPQCPVGLNTLVLPRKSTLPPPDQTPYVYLKCGHVQGQHHWGKEGEDRTCPICLKVGPVSQLSMGLEPAFWVDREPPTYAFNPCGHMASEKTVKYWGAIPIPHGTNGFIGKCPFCATPLEDRGFAKLIFQDHLDS